MTKEKSKDILEQGTPLSERIKRYLDAGCKVVVEYTDFSRNSLDATLIYHIKDWIFITDRCRIRNWDEITSITEVIPPIPPTYNVGDKVWCYGRAWEIVKIIHEDEILIKDWDGDQIYRGIWEFLPFFEEDKLLFQTTE